MLPVSFLMHIEPVMSHSALLIGKSYFSVFYLFVATYVLVSESRLKAIVNRLYASVS